jgi:hypothetical protein
VRFAVNQYPAPLTIDAKTRETLKVLFLAKHALGDGSLHPEDGNHAVYHNEVRTILEGLFDNLLVGNQYAMLFDPPEVDFVFSLLNRGGFVNSDMLVPLSRRQPDPARPFGRQAPVQARGPRARYPDGRLGDLSQGRPGRREALPNGRAHGDQAQRLVGKLGRARRRRLGRREGRDRRDSRGRP